MDIVSKFMKEKAVPDKPLRLKISFGIDSVKISCTDDSKIETEYMEKESGG